MKDFKVGDLVKYGKASSIKEGLFIVIEPSRYKPRRNPAVRVANVVTGKQQWIYTLYLELVCGQK